MPAQKSPLDKYGLLHRGHKGSPWPPTSSPQVETKRTIPSPFPSVPVQVRFPPVRACLSTTVFQPQRYVWSRCRRQTGRCGTGIQSYSYIRREYYLAGQTGQARTHTLLREILTNADSPMLRLHPVRRPDATPAFCRPVVFSISPVLLWPQGS